MALDREQERTLLSAARRSLDELRTFYSESQPPSRSRERIAKRAVLVLDAIRETP